MTASTTPKALTLSSLVATCAALGINVASPPPPGEDKGKTPAAEPSKNRPELPAEVNSETLRTILEALSISGYDLKDEASELVTALEKREAEEAADAACAEELIAEDQAELEAQRRAAETGPSNGDVAAGSASGKSVYARDLNPDAPASFRGFVCAHCSAYNLLRDSKDTWYVVTSGTSRGIYKDWLTVKPMVIGVPHSCYKRYDTHEEALAAWNMACANGTVDVGDRSVRRG
ncbi:hypothetical protein CC1G_02419 [Coprinopsis cinerea okayama7|uniref:Ribonuclease H1 N-terminal domain-containing protein n=1 Tax=Coprinopsis cinerea (strain Okayama-7 / 130 / ATCC MYA-4618 / FGSC 9003) TaxID=240176 RepID=A8NBF9_COPC7|nr:hypothetical protein CC1G_02419 [Coprinopsis cinerea okayama7\|eukprot:XP_001832157.1 hypothetical protein CC1G_02419 [Coprinopsis cinerea okayama7\